MYKYLFFLFYIFLYKMAEIESKQLDINTSAEAAILINLDSGAILYEKECHKQIYPASITKIATALYTLLVYGDKLDTPIAAEHDCIAWVTEDAKKRSRYTLPAYWLEPNATHIGIKHGEILTLNQLLHGMLIASGNDASNVIAKYIGGTIPKFMEELNKYLKSLGCESTHFCNPHGLHHPDHLTTAYDMAIIAKEAMKFEDFKNIVKKTSHVRPKTNKQEVSIFSQTNKLLRRGPNHYPKAIGVKTGWTSIAKNTLVAAAEHKGRRLLAVLIMLPNKDECFKQARLLFEKAYQEPCIQKVLLRKGLQKYALNLPEASQPIKTYLLKDVCVDFFESEEPKLSCKLMWEKLELPLLKDQHVGNLSIRAEDGRLLQTVPLYAVENIDKNWKNNLSFYFSNKKQAVYNFFFSIKYLKTYVACFAFIAISFLILSLRKSIKQDHPSKNFQ